MTDSKTPQREGNREDDRQPIPFDEALRRLVNTPPKPHKKSGDKDEQANGGSE